MSNIFTPPTSLTFGIQGGEGSFNHQALLEYTKQNNITDFQIKFLYTTANVLKAVKEKTINYGLFAIYNVLGGLVEESLSCIGHYKFEIIAQISIPITHHLMKLPTTNSQSLTTIMAHPQVLKQCEKNLHTRYSHLNQLSGQGNLIDTAHAAQALSKGLLPNTYAILGPSNLAKLHNLQVIDTNLQDVSNNQTTFLLVKEICESNF